MSSANPAWLIAQAVKTELTAAFANPTAILAGADFGTFSPQSIAVIAPGAEDNRPGIGARSWVNIYVPEDLALTWETGNSYLAKPIIRVSVFVEETKRLRGSLHETCLSLSPFLTVCLTRSTLNNVARRAPRQTGSTTHKQKGETQTWVSELRLEYEYQGRGAPVDWAKTVPDCDGLTEAAATAAITAAGLTPDSDGAFSATVPKGTVISQSPAAGTAAYAGDIVTITVSFGADITIGRAGADLGPMCTSWRLIEPTRTNPIMTSNTAPAGVASASSVIAAGYEAWKAFDNVIATGAGDWVATAGAFPSWLQYQFATAQVIKAYRITTRNETNFPLSPRSWTFAGSNDGSTWTTLDTQTDVTVWANARNTTRSYYLPTNTTAYTHYRLTITAGNQNYAAVGELELYDALPISALPSKSLYLHNPSSATLNITSITGPDWLTLTGVPATVAAGATATITAMVNTAVAGTYTGDITVVASDGTTVTPVTATVYAPA